MSGSIELRTQVTTLSILEGNILLSVLMREVREGLVYWSLINWLVNPLLIDDWFIHNQYSFADVVDWWPAIYSLHCWPNLSRADNISNFLDYILGWGEKKDYMIHRIKENENKWLDNVSNWGDGKWLGILRRIKRLSSVSNGGDWQEVTKQSIEEMKNDQAEYRIEEGGKAVHHIG